MFFGVLPGGEGGGGFLFERRGVGKGIQQTAMRGNIQKSVRFELAMDFKQPPAKLSQQSDADRLVVDKSPAFAVLAEASLSFLGLGTQPPQSSWGLMIQASRDYLDVAPWTGLVPGAAVAITVLGLNMSGDILRDVFDPRTM